MSIPAKDVKILWGRAAGRCSFPGCGKELIFNDVVVGEMAHIIARSSGGPRGAIPLSPEKRETYSNLILLCCDHHKIVDEHPDKYPPELLDKMKEDHEKRVKCLWEDEMLGSSGYKQTPDYIAILHESLWPVEESAAIRGLGFAPQRLFRISTFLNRQTWEEARTSQETQWQAILNYLQENPSKIAVFSLAHIPLAVHLGWLITNRQQADIYQYDRDIEEWSLKTNVPNDWKDNIAVTGLLRSPVSGVGPCVVRVSVSASIAEGDCREAVSDSLISLNIATTKPSVSNLLGPDEIRAVGKIFRESIEIMLSKAAGTETIHLFYAGPSHLAVHLGRQINSTMWPPVVLYNYDKNVQPCYSKALTLEGGGGL